MDDKGAGLVEVVENCAAVRLPRPKLGLLADQQIITMVMMVMKENGSAVQISRSWWPLLVMIIMITTSK